MNNQLFFPAAPIPVLDAGYQLVELLVTVDSLGRIEVMNERTTFGDCCCHEATHCYYVHNVVC